MPNYAVHWHNSDWDDGPNHRIAKSCDNAMTAVVQAVIAFEEECVTLAQHSGGVGQHRGVTITSGFVYHHMETSDFNASVINLETGTVEPWWHHTPWRKKSDLQGRIKQAREAMKQLDVITEGWDAVKEVFGLPDPDPVKKPQEFHPTVQQFGVLRHDIEKRVEVLIKKMDAVEEERRSWHEQWKEYRAAWEAARSEADEGYVEVGEEDDDLDEEEEDDDYADETARRRGTKKKPSKKKAQHRNRLN